MHQLHNFQLLRLFHIFGIKSDSHGLKRALGLLSMTNRLFDLLRSNHIQLLTKGGAALLLIFSNFHCLLFIWISNLFIYFLFLQAMGFWGGFRNMQEKLEKSNFLKADILGIWVMPCPGTLFHYKAFSWSKESNEGQGGKRSKRKETISSGAFALVEFTVKPSLDCLSLRLLFFRFRLINRGIII